MSEANKKVLSTCLFIGDHLTQNPVILRGEVSQSAKINAYCRTVTHSIINASNLLPTWEIWVYTNNTTPNDWLTTISDLGNCHIKKVDSSVYPEEAMVLTRFIPITDNSVSTTIVFDADGLINAKLVNLVEHFDRSTKEFMFLYNQQNTLMASLVGVKYNTNQTKYNKDLTTYVANKTNMQTWHRDENFLDHEFAGVNQELVVKYQWSPTFSRSYLQGTSSSTKTMKQRASKLKRKSTTDTIKHKKAKCE